MNTTTTMVGKIAVLALITAGFGRAAIAQFKNGSQATELTIPRVSQAASVTQRVGLTDITIAYSAPAVGGREIFGKVVPYGKVWRAGANENTTINFTDDVTVEGNHWLQVATGCTRFRIKTSGRSFSRKTRPPGAALAMTKKKTPCG